jgi:acyl-CoA reductase-like NAD-dependent aldehyde dehydrogenase
MAPTVVRAKSNRNRICQEEIFGPFATLQTFGSPDEAWMLANDTPFGLVSYLWSDDLPTVMAGQAQLRSGLIWVNTPMVRELRAPFGGFKESGVGREGGKACEAFYTEEKTVTIAAGRLPLTKLGLGSPAQDREQRGR